MAKRNRGSRAKNKIQGSLEGALIKADADTFAEAPAGDIHRSRRVAITRSTLFTAEFEAIIELIAKDRVYRAMLAAFKRRALLAAPHTPLLASENESEHA
jgi:hypothetical protein